MASQNMTVFTDTALSHDSNSKQETGHAENRLGAKTTSVGIYKLHLHPDREQLRLLECF